MKTNFVQTLRFMTTATFSNIRTVSVWVPCVPVWFPLLCQRFDSASWQQHDQSAQGK